MKAAVNRAQALARTGAIGPGSVAEAAALPPAAVSLTSVINATGVIVHTNLGRAPLSAAARDALPAATGCTHVEFDLATGKRARHPAAQAAEIAYVNVGTRQPSRPAGQTDMRDQLRHRGDDAARPPTT